MASPVVTRVAEVKDAEGILPAPWVVYRKAEPPDQGTPYYYNEETKETQWVRPVPRISLQAVVRAPGASGASGQLEFDGWLESMSQGLPQEVGYEPSTVHSYFRDFLQRLQPYGCFTRYRDGTLWRLRAGQPVGIALDPPRRVFVIHSPSVQLGQPPTGLQPTGPLDDASKVRAMEYLLQCLVSRRPCGEALLAREGHLYRRYAAEAVPPPRRPPRPPSAQAAALASYLSSFNLVPPFSCKLTGASNLRDVQELAEHLASERALSWRHSLLLAVELLDRVQSGEVPLSEWLPQHEDAYRRTLGWNERRFQEFPAADGRVFRFDHARGTGWMVPESLVSAASVLNGPSAPLRGASSGASGAALGAEGLLRLVEESLGFTGRGQNLQVPAVVFAQQGLDELGVEPDLDPPWTAHMDAASGSPFYYNPATNVTQWERPLSVAVGESWSAKKSTAMRQTSAGLFQRYQGIIPRPQRAVPV